MISRKYHRYSYSPRYQYAKLGLFRMTVTVPALILVLIHNHHHQYHHRFVASAFSTTYQSVSYSSSIHSSNNNRFERTTTTRQRRRRRNTITTTATATTTLSKSLPICNLFFRSTDAENNLPESSSKRQQQRQEQALVFDRILNELGSPTITLPYEAVVVEEDSLSTVLTIRHMTPSDLDQVTDMCIEEFGTGPTTKLQDIPFLLWGKKKNKNKGEEDGGITLEQWWDRLCFEPSVRIALQAKMRSNNTNKNKNNHQDPSILVLSRKEKRPNNNYNNQQQQLQEQGNNNDYYDDDDDNEIIVGLVEVSLQPPIPDRNPPTYPLPKMIKNVYYCQLVGIDKLQGWVTNLLIAPNFRGLGYSKILMAATEGIARSWGCDYMYLHADADVTSGKIPQSLYENLGYHVVLDNGIDGNGGVGNNDNNNLYDWIPKNGGTVFSSSIRMVQGVALLWFGKQL